tara:strand:+ start:669 stop:1550 length:882 start_codon:yes stop_codon:yes gene_type:complete
VIEYSIIDDSAIALGGTSLTLDAIVEPFKDKVEFIATSELTPTHLQFKNPRCWILGNTMGMNQVSYATLVTLLQTKPTVKIDFDYGYCRHRGPTPHRILGKKECDCLTNPETQSLKNIYSLIKEKASHIFYMSAGQREIHKNALGIPQDKTTVLSSCFLPKHFEKMRSLREVPKNNKYAIIQGHPGWHSQAKGVSESVSYALDHNLEYEIISTDTHDEMLDKLSAYKGLIFLPIIEDTCPRITIEAKLLGLEVITSGNSQHTTEEWWNGSLENIENYLKERPSLFHQTLLNLI